MLTAPPVAHCGRHWCSAAYLASFGIMLVEERLSCWLGGVGSQHWSEGHLPIMMHVLEHPWSGPKMALTASGSMTWQWSLSAACQVHATLQASVGHFSHAARACMEGTQELKVGPAGRVSTDIQLAHKMQGASLAAGLMACLAVQAVSLRSCPYLDSVQGCWRQLGVICQCRLHPAVMQQWDVQYHTWVQQMIWQRISIGGS